MAGPAQPAHDLDCALRSPVQRPVEFLCLLPGTAFGASWPDSLPPPPPGGRLLPSERAPCLFYFSRTTGGLARRVVLWAALLRLHSSPARSPRTVYAGMGVH